MTRKGIVSRTRRPIPQALIVSTDFVFFNELLLLPLYLAGQTNSAGQAVYPRDFKFYENWEDIERGIEANLPFNKPSKISRGKELIFNVKKEGYLSASFEIEAQNNVTIELEQNRGNSKLQVYYSMEIPEEYHSEEEATVIERNRYVFNELQKIYLEKKNPQTGEWERFNKLPIVLSVAERKAIFYPQVTGYFRAGITGSRFKSGEELFDNTQDVDIAIGRFGCPFIFEDDLIKRYPDNIVFVFEDETIYQTYQNNKSFFDELALKIRQLKNRSINFPLIINWDNFLFANAGAIETLSLKCLGMEDVYSMHFSYSLLNWFLNQGLDEQVMAIIAHEYGHLTHAQLNLDNPNFIKLWEKLFQNISSSSFKDCVWEAILDSNVALLPHRYAGHPWDNDGEMFASFFAAYFTNHERLHGIIKYHTQNGSSCQNTLSYMWQLFAEKVGQVYADDHLVFEPVGGKLGNANYTFSQIGQGNWMKEKYNKMGLVGKSIVQFSRIIGPFITQLSPENLRAKVGQLNDWTDRLLRRLGLWRNTGTLRGKLVDQNGESLAGFLIQIDAKTAITDSDGKFRMGRILEGSQKIIKIQKTKSNNLYQDKIISPSDKAVDIIKNQTKNIRIIINFNQ